VAVFGLQKMLVLAGEIPQIIQCQATSTLGISSSDPNVIYAGSGEPFGNLDNLTGVGVIKSTDAGETWTYLSNTASFGSVGRVLVNPTNSNHVIVGTSKGIYVSTNGGTLGRKLLQELVTTTNVQDIVSKVIFLLFMQQLILMVL
jgi:hypothetical protein